MNDTDLTLMIKLLQELLIQAEIDSSHNWMGKRREWKQRTLTHSIETATVFQKIRMQNSPGNSLICNCIKKWVRMFY